MLILQRETELVISEKEKLIEMYRKMLLIRYFEEKVLDLFNRNVVGGPLHLYSGEEAIAIGACSVINDDDYITSTHRGHGHCIAKNGNVGNMLAELLGKEAGYCKGRGGSMHIADFDKGMLGANGIVGGGLPIAVGAALGSEMLGTGRVTLCFFGDGASNTGNFHEALNLAGVWKLPVVFICENNLYAISVPTHKSLPIDDVADRAASYGFAGKVIDGNDIMAVYKTVGAAVKKARSGGGPTLIECKTYRFHGHFVGDLCNYRTEEEVEQWKKKDPIKRFMLKLIKDKVITTSKAADIENEVCKTIAAAEKFAVEAPAPKAESVLDDLYA